jgi:putative transposase
MPRIARIIAPGYPHHVTQRGNRRQQTFFSEDDYQSYIELMAQWCGQHGVSIWAYCLMPNHVHLIAVPQEKDSLHLAIGEAHRRYTRRINFREGWRGHLWQGRFSSYVMDEKYLLACARYVENNPVRANLSDRAEKWRWSSAAAHVSGTDDRLVTVNPLLRLVKKKWSEFLHSHVSEDERNHLLKHERTGRPLCEPSFLERLEVFLDRPLKPQKPGRKPKQVK